MNWLVAVFISLHSVSDRADEGVNPSAVERCRQARDPYAAESVLRKLFRNASLTQLRELSAHRDPSIAFRAELERLKRSISQDGVQDDRSGGERPPSSSIENFLGFVSGRLRVPVPQWWESSVRTMRGRQYVWFPELPKADALFSRSDVDSLWAAKELKLTEEAEKIVIGVSGKECRLEKQWILNVNVEGVDGITALAGRHDIFVALLSNRGHGFNICAVDPQSNKIRWVAPVWANEPMLVYSGGPPQAPSMVTLTIRHGKLYVFGAAVDGVYVEAFKVRNGENVFRFTTSY